MPLVRPFIFMASVKWEWAMKKKMAVEAILHSFNFKVR